MKKIGAFLAVIIIIAASVYASYWLSKSPYVTVSSMVFSLTALFIGVVIFFENRNPSSTLAWLIVLALFPFLGFVVYLFIGQNYRKKKKFYRKGLADESNFLKVERSNASNWSRLSKMGSHQQLFFKLAHKLGKSPVSFASPTKILTNGEQKFKELFEAIQKAKHHIHLEYYIVRSDGIGNELKQLLIQKAKEGVEIRFLYDAVGSLRLAPSFREELVQAGIQMVPFFPVKLPYFNQKINFRNHRKIAVIDGNIGFVGGLNIGDEYLGKHPYYGFWRDTHLMVKGEAVRSLQLIFLQDWSHMTGETLLTSEYLSPVIPDRTENFGGVQLVAGGPDTEWEVLKNLYFSMIITAKKSVWMATPYFVPDEEIFTALRIAALSGIDVRLLVPSKPDKKTVFHASRSYFPDLLKAGVKIFEYEKGFMHSKIVIVDGELASIGTCNMDMRSFHLNFEVNAFLFRTESTKQLVEDFEHDVECSKPIHLEDFNGRKLQYRVLESLSRLLSPLL